ncbi:MAG: serine hydrolase [Gemmatimonadales bacterium]
MTRSAVLRVILIATAQLGGSTLSAQTRRFPADSVVQAILNEQVTAKKTAGIVVGLLDADGSRRVLVAGKSDNPGVALDGNTVFEIGSITKTFTGVLLAEMVARGDVRLDDRVQQFLPASVKMPARNGREITLLDLGTVSSGLPGMPNNFKPADPGNPYADYTVQQMYDFLNGHTLTRDIGSKYEYSNLGMGLLGHVLALKAGKSYYDLLNDRILKPLGMGDTEIVLSPRLRGRLALGHDKAGNVVPNWDLPTLAGAGALRSSVNDMFKYLAANLDSTSRPLGRVFATTHTSRTETGAPGVAVGMAWHILKTPGGSIVWHNGGTGGYRTFMGFDRSKQVGVIMLTNSSISADDVGLHLIDPAVPLSKPPVARVAKAIDPALLPLYVGAYQLAPEVIIDVTLENGALWVAATGQPKVRLLAESDSSFFIAEDDIALTFDKEGGVVTQLVLRQPGGQTPAKKIR